MESASGKKPLVRYWLHTAFLMVDGHKMSKSLGNFYTIDDVIQKGFDPLALRYLFLGAHYRDTLNFTWDSLQASQNGLERLRNLVNSLKSETERTVLSEEKEGKIETFRNDFLKSLSDDLNTPQALAVLWEMLKSNIPSEDKYDLAMSFDEILGLKLSETTNKKSQIPSDIQTLIDQRQKLREEGKYDEADKIRDQIQKLGFNLNDKPLK
jgi:cysteinyl-tRNA synthetase